MTRALNHPAPAAPTAPPAPARPRLGFLGVGWIGRHRMQAIAHAGIGEVAAVADTSGDALDAALAELPQAHRATSLAELLGHDLDGIVIATPTALHAEQVAAALDRGLTVFCQKPLARTAREVRHLIDAARRADRLLSVDFSYRHTAAVSRALDHIRTGQLGTLYAIDLAFHNAYGPDKPWFRDPALAGGGCLIDLGVHLIDLALLALGGPRVAEVSGHLYRRGRPLATATHELEDYAVAQFTTDAGAHIRLACSWWLHAGQDAVIEATLHGDNAAIAIRNVGGSFFDFRADLLRGTAREPLAAPPDDWGGRAAVAWARQLARSPRFDPSIESAHDVASVIDRIYAR